MQYFVNSLEHLLAELERIDLLIRAQVAQARQMMRDDEQFRGLYISEREVDDLLRQPIGRPRWLQGQSPPSYLSTSVDQISQQISLRKQESLQRGTELRLDKLQQLFKLNRFEIEAVLVCMAVELDLRYERLYAYLQDDVTKKKPSVDLVLNLLQPSVEIKLRAREHFSPNAPLLRHRLLEFIDDPSQPCPSLLAKYLKIDDRVAHYLLGSDELDARIQPFTEIIEPREELNGLLLDVVLKDGLGRLFNNKSVSGDRLVVHLKGAYGIGKQSTAEAVCRKHSLGLLIVDIEQLAFDGGNASERVLGLINREAQLQNAALYWKGFDILLSDQHRRLFNAFRKGLEGCPSLTFLAGETSWESADSMCNASFVTVGLPRPTSLDRSRIWSRALNGRRPNGSALDVDALASKFRFTGGQIHDAAATAQNLAHWRDPESGEITMKDLYEACRLHSHQKLSELARKITPHYQWDDLVLPADRLMQLREVCNYVKYRNRVYDEWGFDQKLSMGKGLSVLFAGPSGTGKTMAADIIAGELCLDLYKIDLSTVVSKYIGETEKNLSRIFAEAETSNAILFFDEADALFGRRSEVKDSHDRYANIEIGYLLQRMEEYEGVVILATNFRKNMDEAFVRRLHFTVEYPFPNKEDRCRIWEGIWPGNTPREPTLDLGFMAQRFEITGGNIRNIALAAAFLAADNSGRVNMDHLIRATQREYQKMGKVITQTEIGNFAGSKQFR